MMNMILIKEPICQCSCGQLVKTGNNFINGHNMKGKSSPFKGKTLVEIHGEEKAQQLINKHLGNTYSSGRKNSKETLEKMRLGRLGKKDSKETLIKKRASALTPKNIARRTKELEEGIISWPRGESYPESVFREYLESLGAIKGEDFEQEYRVGTYRLDFAYVDEKRYVEIDGKQHLLPEDIEHDRIRDEWLEKQGWIGIRLPAKGLVEYLYK